MTDHRRPIRRGAILLLAAISLVEVALAFVVWEVWIR